MCKLGNSVIYQEETNLGWFVNFKRGVDFEKAYDSLNWDFIHLILEKMGLVLNREVG